MKKDNNSSAFNFRFISHTTRISKHGLGLAVDINTLYNPYTKIVDGEWEDRKDYQHFEIPTAQIDEWYPDNK